MHRRGAGNRGHRGGASRWRIALNWTERILRFPVRTAAVEDFLRDLKASGSADLNAVMTTLNDAGLCREVLAHWKEQGWVEVARSMPLVALRGDRFSWDVTLRVFCGEPRAEESSEDGAD